jgi:UDP-glucose 4-epimerase
MHWLITGGAGFIGSHLTEALLERGDQVTVIDDLSTGRRRNLAGLQDHPRFQFVEGSILDRDVLEPLVVEADGVYHFAAAVGVRLIISQPVATIATNILGSEAVFGVAARHGTKVLLASTSEVYGKNEEVPFREDCDSVFGTTTKSRWSYACSKAIDEFLALAYHKERNLPVIIVRFFNTVGPRQTGAYGMVLPTLVRQALEERPLTVFGDGQQTRCFTSVTDAVRASIALMDHPRAVGEIFNLGGQQEIAIAELAERVLKLSGSSSKIEHIEYDKAYERGFEDMRRRIPDTSKLRALIGFAPGEDLDGIIRSVIDYCRKNAE